MDDKLFHGPMHGGPHFHSGPPGERGMPGVSPKIEVGDVEEGSFTITVTDGYGQTTYTIPLGDLISSAVDAWMNEHDSEVVETNS